MSVPGFLGLGILSLIVEMAENVELALERMLPALQDLEKRRIFEPSEISAIIDRRRRHEYKLQKRTAELGDFVRYIEDELRLERLRRMRTARLRRRLEALSGEERDAAKAAAKGGEGDFAGQRHVHKLFERALNKFGQRADGAGPALWEQYATFAEREGAGRTLSRLYGRALALHPGRASLWVRAASWEWIGSSCSAAI